MTPPEIFRNDIKKCFKEIERKKICKKYNKEYFDCLNNYILKDQNVICKDLYILLKKNKCFDLKI